jgi:hypothetical protein
VQYPTDVDTDKLNAKSRNISAAASFNMVAEEEFDRTGVPAHDPMLQRALKMQKRLCISTEELF